MRCTAEAFEIAIETNGTVAAPEGIDWICVSPNRPANSSSKRPRAKLVYPQADAPPEDSRSCEFEKFLLQPMDGPDAWRTRGAR